MPDLLLFFHMPTTPEPTVLEKGFESSSVSICRLYPLLGSPLITSVTALPSQYYSAKEEGRSSSWFSYEQVFGLAAATSEKAVTNASIIPTPGHKTVFLSPLVSGMACSK